MKCPQCRSKMEEIRFDIGYGIEVDSTHCKKCGFNITNNKKLKRALNELHKQMSKEVRIVRVGTGLGIRLSNDIVRNYKLKAGENVLLKPEIGSIKVIVEKKSESSMKGNL